MISELAFEAYLSYCPRKRWPSDPTPAMKTADEWMKAIKGGYRAELRGRSPYIVIAEQLKSDARASAIGAVFLTSVRPSLVPVPRSSLSPRTGPFSWPARDMALALVANGFGHGVLPLLKRARALPKASMGGERNAFLQRDSLVTTMSVVPPRPIVLVDDIITTGASMMGSALRLLEAFPGLSELAGFSAMRTISEATEFTGIRAYTTGVVRLRKDGVCLRRP